MSAAIDYSIFKFEDGYKMNIDVINQYMDSNAMLISKTKGIPLKESKDILRKILKESNIKNPNVTYKSSDDVGDRHVTVSKLTEYLTDLKDKNEVLAPSFTTYIHPDTKKSLHAIYLDLNTKERSRYKKMMFDAKNDGDTYHGILYNYMQSGKKIYNNSLSGTYASNSTVLYNESGHYALTSITRCVSGIGNGVTESMVSGNKMFITPEITFNYITSILNNVKMSYIELAISKFNLYTPTPLEVMEHILRSTRWYWSNEEKENEILFFLQKLSPIELAAILYVNDFYHIRKYNDAFVRMFLKKLTMKVKTGVTDLTYIKKTESLGIDNLAKIICADEIRGKKLDYEALRDTDELDTLLSTAKNSIDVLNEYRIFIKSFFVTNIIPPDIGEIKKMMRDSIVLSDTDSTCGSYDEWVEWYYGKMVFNTEATALAAGVMTIVTQVIDHQLNILTANMNVKEELRSCIKMKNEYYWSVFIVANIGKHYFANTLIREGNTFTHPEMELKGVNFHASNANKRISKRIHELLKELMNTITNNEEVSLNYYINEVVKLEQSIIDSIDSGSIEMFKQITIKPESAYAKSGEESPYMAHIFWNEVFADKYGYPGEPMYMAVKVGTTTDNKSRFNEFVENIEDKELKERMINYCNKYNKTSISTFRFPVGIVSSTGIPIEVRNIIDKNSIIKDNVYAGYLLLETIGFYRKGDMSLLEMGYTPKYDGDNNEEKQWF